jgi:hypothetical protein
VILAATDWTKWSAIGTLVAAFATLGLASVTVWLVVVTKRMVTGAGAALAATNRLAEATRRQAETAVHALSLQVEPRIVPVHEIAPSFARTENIGGSVGTHWVMPLIVTVQNVGAGVAELTRVEAAITDWGPPDVRFPGIVRSATSAELRAEFTTPGPTDRSEPPPEVPPGADVYVRVHYRGAGSREYQVAFSWFRAAGSEARWQLRLGEAIGHTELS